MSEAVPAFGTVGLSAGPACDELAGVRAGHGQDVLAEVSQPHPVSALPADQELPLEVSFQLLNLRGQCVRGDVRVAAVRRRESRTFVYLGTGAEAVAGFEPT